MVGLPPSTLSGLLQDITLHKGPPHIDIVGDPLSLASYKFEKVDHIPGLRKPRLQRQSRYETAATAILICGGQVVDRFSFISIL